MHYPSLSLLTLLLTLSPLPINAQDDGDGANGSGTPGGAIGATVCLGATPEVNHLPYPGDCTKFIVCDLSDGVSTIYTCDEGLYFSVEVQTCTWPEDSGCVQL
ncbi:chitin binding peritrophin-A domain-containing protein [Aspergillus ibericus CBS 121593]|uniref:Chitin-binding type-2 domain-containing protein n=1 Tax=Aspergillus ibericus CBS 121593 TaxID=1448316 RepID=A0A395H9B1_9EURO|nr:hypothetical protein BO80DRAFT_461627 [Aspergillus ibericus CBS 121593]RAL04541.1 hypothetical protein BO80DRAFT_461627 [Aspergillus ibericus CBS 121593]